MRPERLALSAFGPFAGEQVFDFADLGPARLFLIHGPTGSGKTTLLDALCFALFGSSSGDERTAEHLRSHHAAAATLTWVELDFRLGAERYRIRRAPAQQVIGRGGKLVKTPPKVTLWRREDDALVVLADQERRVKEAIEGLLGYSDDEFRQVVVLPQGRFREVLTAKADVRQAILATLFRTGLYRRIEALLAARAKTALDEAKQVEERRRTLLAEAAAATPEAAADAVAELAARREAADQQVEPLRATAKAAAAALTQGQQIHYLLRQATETAAALAALVAREPEMAADRDRLAAGRRAETTVAADRLHDNLQRLAMRAKGDADTAAKSLQNAQTRHAQASERLLDEAPRLRSIETGRTEADRLNTSARAAQAAETAEKEAADLQRRLGVAQAAHAKARAEAGSAATDLEVAIQARAEASRKAETAPFLRDALKQARGVAEETAQAAKLAARLIALTRSRDAAREAADAARDAWHTAIAARNAAEAGVRAQHALDLARHLTDGAPCPVCGSLDHPRVARASGTEFADLEAAAAAEEAARTRHGAASDAAGRAESDRARATDQLESIRSRLPDGIDDAEAARRVAVADTAAAAATDAEKSLPARVTAMASATARRDAAAGAARATEAAARELEQQAQILAGEIRARRADAPIEAGGSAALFQAAATLVEAIRGVEKQLESDRAELASSASALQSSRERLTSEMARAKEARGQEEAALAELRLACEAAGFADVEAARAARLSPDRLAALEASLRAFDDQLSRAHALAGQARNAAAGLRAPDLPALEAADQAARLAANTAAEQAATLRERHDRAEHQLASLVAADTALNAARARHDLLRGLASATAGNNEKRLSLEGFVLASILDEALAAANEHLGRMLGGRYRVRRREEPARANAAIGLDIEVLDEWTGIERPAGTLSGGEGFCAALALALGLADTVQAHAGARRIDTLFIDEGFGALDEDALDTAMDVLDRLQAGDRLVGIISHVAELRGRIAAQLVVRPGARGSTAGFVG